MGRQSSTLIQELTHCLSSTANRSVRPSQAILDKLNQDGETQGKRFQGRTWMTIKGRVEASECSLTKVMFPVRGLFPAGEPRLCSKSVRAGLLPVQARASEVARSGKAG